MSLSSEQKAAREEALQYLLGFIEGFIEVNGYSPSVRDIKESCGYSSTSTVRYDLDKLKADGLISWKPGQSRTLTLTGGAK